MEEAQELSDHIGIMDHGKLIAYGTHDELVKIVGEMDRMTVAISADSLSPESDRVIEAWKSVSGVSQVNQEDGALQVLADDSNLVLPRLFEVAAHNGTRITSIDIEQPNLESVFLHLTGRALRD
jgi:ABC-2 type transport system ATP-binding protein